MQVKFSTIRYPRGHVGATRPIEDGDRAITFREYTAASIELDRKVLAAGKRRVELARADFLHFRRLHDTTLVGVLDAEELLVLREIALCGVALEAGAIPIAEEHAAKYTQGTRALREAREKDPDWDGAMPWSPRELIRRWEASGYVLEDVSDLLAAFEADGTGRRLRELAAADREYERWESKADRGEALPLPFAPNVEDGG